MTRNIKPVGQTNARAGERMMIFILAVFAANMRACITGVGSLVPLIGADFGLSKTQAGLITTLPILIFALVSYPAPGISRRFGTGQTLMVSFLLIFAGLAVRSYCGMPGLFIGSGLLAVGIGFSNVLVVSMIKLRFSHRIGFVTGLYSASMAFSAAVSVGISVPMAVGLGLGWRNALAVWMLLAGLSVVLWGVRMKKDPEIRRVEKGGGSKSSLTRTARRMPMAWCYSAFFGIQTLLFFVMSAWLPSMLQSRGYSLEQAAATALYVQALNIPTTLCVPVLCARRRDQRGLILIFCGMLFAGLTGFMFVRGTIKTLITLAVFSLGLGSALGFSNTFISLRTENAQESAALSGMGQTVGYLFGAGGPVLIGFIFDLTGSWTLPLLLLVFASAAYILIGLSLARDRSFFREFAERKAKGSGK
ncbi:MAG: MFS transporter [Oscillospiraceae bacterium]|nr:MFS transporter [Oscillospiraceae bacterium]